MKMRRRVIIPLSALLLCLSAEASQHDMPCKDWKALRGKNLQCGFPTEQVDRALGTCRKRGLTAPETDALLGPVYTASKESLPAECILLKIEEGLAKQVDAERLTAAAQFRLECLRKAQKIIAQKKRGPGQMGSGPPRLLTHTGLALESGLPEEVLQDVFKRQGGRRMGRLVHVIEAGETLQLAGLEPKDTQQILFDCIDRKLAPLEIERVVEYVVAEHGEEIPFPEIRRRLWDKTG